MKKLFTVLLILALVLPALATPFPRLAAAWPAVGAFLGAPVGRSAVARLSGTHRSAHRRLFRAT